MGTNGLRSFADWSVFAAYHSHTCSSSGETTDRVQDTFGLYHADIVYRSVICKELMHVYKYYIGLTLILSKVCVL